MFAQFKKIPLGLAGRGPVFRLKKEETARPRNWPSQATDERRQAGVRIGTARFAGPIFSMARTRAPEGRLCRNTIRVVPTEIHP
jgi:hypothetical protein